MIINGSNNHQITPHYMKMHLHTLADAHPHMYTHKQIHPDHIIIIIIIICLMCHFPFIAGCMFPMFVHSAFFHSKWLSGSMSFNFPTYLSWLIVSVHVFLGLPLPLVPSTLNSEHRFIQLLLLTCPYQHSQL